MRKKITIFALSLAVMPSVCAQQSNTNTLVVSTKEGTQFKWPITEQPRVQFRDGSVVVTLASSPLLEEASIPFGDFDHISYEYKDYTGLQNINQTKERKTHFYQRDATVFGEGLIPESSVVIYAENGAELALYKADAAGCCRIPLQGLSSRVLIINSGSVTFKIVKK